MLAPLQQKISNTKKVSQGILLQQKMNTISNLFTVICNMGLDEMFKWPKQFLNPLDFPGRFMAVIYVYTYIHIIYIYIYIHL